MKQSDLENSLLDAHLKPAVTGQMVAIVHIAAPVEMLNKEQFNFLGNMH